jgi:hypothetical protein|eukprot:TRINITY_DN54659_c0_g1_i1.p1 TRINITY_DN54659_c0_g1~~TRINITY_DN54659_c0_g1_i1.p1  ORF type:complete len:163 (-),score=29.55 TRINITY_DN54659_c0_g1_i1:406-894(-)
MLCTVVSPAVTSFISRCPETLGATVHVQTTVEIGSSSLRPPPRGASFHERLDAKSVGMFYLMSVLVCRVALRTSASAVVHWAIIMLVEDGMSIMTFALAFAYLVRSDGAPLTAIAKCFSPSAADAMQEAAVRVRRSSDGTVSTLEGHPIVDPRLVRFYYFGL